MLASNATYILEILPIRGREESEFRANNVAYLICIRTDTNTDIDKQISKFKIKSVLMRYR